MALVGSRAAPPRPTPRQPASARPPQDALHAAGEPAIAPPRVARTRPWEGLLALRDALEPALARIAAGEGRAAPALATVRDAGAELQRLCALDPDAVLALPQLLRDGRYGTRHAMSTAAVLEFMLARLDAPAAERRSTMLAALTMNVGMHALQERLWSHAGPLTPVQRAGVLGHPALGAALLRAAGVTDPLWLAIVAQHHEHLDGTGYPFGLAGDAVVPQAQALMVAERWCALVAPRAYRDGAPPDRALALLRTRLGAQADPEFVGLLAGTVGTLPPGTPVRLASGELGLVFRRTADPHAPLVLALRDPQGAPHPAGVCRATSEPRQRIEETVRPDVLGDPPDPVRIWEAIEVVEAVEADAAGR
jgi:hypothetical protein